MALFDMKQEPLLVNHERANSLISPQTIAISPLLLLLPEQADPDQVTLLCVQDFGMSLFAIHEKHVNREAYLKYILKPPKRKY